MISIAFRLMYTNRIILSCLGCVLNIDFSFSHEWEGTIGGNVGVELDRGRLWSLSHPILRLEGTTCSVGVWRNP